MQKLKLKLKHWQYITSFGIWWGYKHCCFFLEMDSQISVEKRKACVRSQIKDMSVLDKTTGTLYPHVRPRDKKEGGRGH